MSSSTHLDEVFGVTRDIPGTYTERARVDGELIESLTRDKHIVIYGSSKQGKTSLRKWTLQPEDYALVTCTNRMSLAKLNEAILKSVNYVVAQSQSRTSTGSTKITVKGDGKVKLFGWGAGVSAEAGRDRSRAQNETTSPMELDPEDVNDIIDALQQAACPKFIVLEDFHYLPEETQRNFAVTLKAFHESSQYVFMIVGVWLEENRLVHHNGDLTGRVTTITADTWTETELDQVIAKGEELLNIEFDPRFRAELVTGCFASVWILQEACRQICREAGIYRTVDTKLTGLGAAADARALVRQVVEMTQSARYMSFLTNFSAGFTDTDLEMYRWLMLPVLAASPEALERGLRYSEIRQKIDQHHPNRPVHSMNLTKALRNAAGLQVKKNITPVILDFNQAENRLDVVDRGFLVWLRYQDREQLLADLELPVAALRAS